MRSKLACFAVAVVLVGVTAWSVEPENEVRAVVPSCIHELVYEPFAGVILVSVTINGSPPLDFILDSGATGSSITDPYLAAALGLEVTQAGLARGMGSGATRVLVTEEATIKADGFEILHTPLVVHDIGERLASMAGRDIHGFLGVDLFERWVVEIDPAARRLVLHEPEEFSIPHWGEVIPLEVVDGRAIIEADVEVEAGKKPLDVRLVVDTGSGRYLTLITGSKRRLMPPETRSVGASVGVVGETLVPIAPVARLTVGTRVTERVETAWLAPYQIPAVRNIPKLNGILGNALLSRYRVVIDFDRRRMVMTPVFGNPDTVNGMSN